MATLAEYKKYGIKYNYNAGTLNGENFNWRRNFYHKPIASVNWEAKLGSKSTLSSTVYASAGRGGGTGDLGRAFGFCNYLVVILTTMEDIYLEILKTGYVNYDKIASYNGGNATTFYNGRTYQSRIDAATGLWVVNDQDERIDGEKRNGVIQKSFY